ncbi:MAG: hypothetical protein ABFD02_07610, partial [Bacteroidales bacterium]
RGSYGSLVPIYRDWFKPLTHLSNVFKNYFFLGLYGSLVPIYRDWFKPLTHLSNVFKNYFFRDHTAV